MPDIRELGRKVKAKYPGVYDDLDDGYLGRRVKAKYPGAYDDFADTPAQQPEGAFSSFQTGVAGPLLRNVVNTAVDLYNRPLETLERAGRGALEFAAAFDPVGAAYEPTVRDQAARVAELQRRAEAERPENLRLIERGMREEEAKPRTTAGRIAFGTGRVLGEVAFPTAPETLAGNIVAVPFGGAAARSAGVAFKAGVNSVKRTFGKGAAQIVEAEATPAAVAQVRREIGEPPPLTAEPIPSSVAPSVDLLPTVYAKLGTDNVEQIGAMIANANRRFGKKRTPSQIQSSMEDYKALQSLTPDEQRALSQVLPARSVSPVGEFPQGGYSRDIRDIPASEPNPQVDANLRQLEEFFGSEGRALQEAEDAAIMGDIGPGAFGGQVAQPARVSAADLITSAPPTGGRISPETGPPALSADLGISTPAPSVRAASVGATGPSASAPLDALNVSVSQAAQSIPAPVGKRILNELAAIYHLPKSLLSSVDISAPFRQGSLLTLPPSQWGRAGRAAVKMFQAFSTKKYDEITQQIAAHIDAPIADDAGLYLASKAKEGLGKAEEAFLSKYAGRIPLVKQSQQAYTTYLDALRMDTFAKYKRVIDGQGLSPDQAQKAYKAAAEWINFATGRGSVGQRFDRVMDAANFFLFSPRYVASRFNVLNPAYYARNAATPGGRAVLKQQMGELVQYAGVVAGTMALAKAAGADVGLNPKESDFLKIRFGNYRYDMLAGLQQVMRLVYRTTADIGNRISGEKTQGPGALDIAGTFLRTKLAPAPAVFVDFLKGRTLGGDKPTAGGALVNLTTPIQWADFVEAYQKDGWGGVGMAAPGLTGVGVQRYELDPVEAAIDRTRPLLSEIQRLNIRVTELQRGKDKQDKNKPESDESFNARVQQFGQNYTSYGLRLIQDPRFQAASDDVKIRALKRLNEKAKGLTHKQFGFAELELDPGLILDSVEK